MCEYKCKRASDLKQHRAIVHATLEQHDLFLIDEENPIEHDLDMLFLDLKDKEGMDDPFGMRDVWDAQLGLNAVFEGPDAQTDLDGLDAQVEESQEASASAIGVDEQQPESAQRCASV